MPVFLFGFGALVLAALIATWGNYFYNWVFTSKFVGFFAVLLTFGFVLMLMFTKNWEFQAITTEFTKEMKDDPRAMLGQIIVSQLLVFEGLAILCAVAIACSTRLGQVMTLLICFAVYGLGVCSDYMFGRHADDQPLAWLGYHVTPNVSYLFVADALSQGSPVTPGYLGMASAYAALFAVAILCIAVALFQTRETG
jgi:hypothetical protein